MTTGWKKLTRRDLSTFDNFATDAVLTAMEQGGTGRIGTNGHARIRGKDGASITIARDTSAPHCQGNVLADLRRAFPDLRTNGTTREEVTVTGTKTDEMLDCPAKGCEEKFSSVLRLGAHIKEDHAVCKWEGCDYGPNGGPYIGRTWHGVAGHTNIKHKGNQPWMKNREKAAANRAATVATKREARQAAEHSVAEAMSNGHSPTPTLAINPVRRDSRGEIAENRPTPPTLTVNPSLGAVPPAAEQQPPAVPADSDAEAKLALIQEILGENPEVARLKKELADVKAHLALVREAVGLDFGDDDS